MLHGCHMMSTLSRVTFLTQSIASVGYQKCLEIRLASFFSALTEDRKMETLLARILIINTLTVLLWIKDKLLGQAGFG